ncbi:diaminopimelate epimerase [Nocardia miyunensis]|uniref:diaminopimelate epimerase n=1 Tax=Nocardia miyunensis TaxID=282684 RepID=UPI00082CD26F|nr:diaminopimelate epimerase [Nocardia miyunensis]
MHGAGNDFILVADSADMSGADLPQLAQWWCARRTGVGADGLVITRLITGDVLQVRCINADGSEASMCGNALRCAAWCAARDHALSEPAMVMAGVVHHAQVGRDRTWVTANLGAVQPDLVQVVVGGRRLSFDAAYTGTEHVVAVVEDVEDIDVETVGRQVRNHPDLAPRGANVNFVQRVGPRRVRLRTYERGVEAETLSCGSGAVAAAVIAHRHNLIDLDAAEQVIVHNRAGTPLVLRPHPDSHTTAFWIGGPVTCVFEGELS